VAGNDPHVSLFEQIRHEAEDGGEYWSARELAKVLGYAQWRNFTLVIAQAQTACEHSGQVVANHFADTSKMVTLGSGAQRRIADWRLSRYACYLVVQNADPEKPIVALGQTYFAVQARRAELADDLELAGMTEAQKRLALRQQMASRNVELAAAASDAGVVTSRDFAIFQDHGYMGLYAGERARDIAARKGLAPGEKVLDWMNSEELAANWFRATQAAAKLEREGITGKASANRTHYEVGRKVRQTIAELGGTMPEELPTPGESIKEIERRERKRLEAERQPSLFGSGDASEDEEETDGEK
jgi:DNA-damage-inducible protein D